MWCCVNVTVAYEVSAITDFEKSGTVNGRTLKNARGKQPFGPPIVEKFRFPNEFLVVADVVP